MGRGLATVCSVTAPLGGGGGCHVPLGHLKRARMPVQCHSLIQRAAADKTVAGLVTTLESEFPVDGPNQVSSKFSTGT